MAADPIADLEDGLPDEAAGRLYLRIIDEGGRIPIEAVAVHEKDALDQLLAVGLLLTNPLDGAYIAVSPRTVGDRVGADMRARAAGLLHRAERLPDAFAALAHAYEALPRGDDERHHAVYVEGQDRIRHRIAELMSECKEELLAAQPGSRGPETRQLARRQDTAMLDRGGRMRTLYQPVVLTEPGTVGYAAELSALGAHVRVLDEPFQRMIVIDRKTAVIPASDDNNRAVFISDPAAVAFLVAGFDRDWARADVVLWDQLDAPAVSRSVSDRIGRLLAAGLTQRGVATRLGLSERTVAGHISRLRERYGAQTLFQLGWLMRGGRDE
ncbi:LuxR C-terminal-related transcriptional regulator [Kitasatospora camelliae]|uniref:LuxR C-terminal-related transcriptional regulator n=1 Tax=Kitasatospora camelliae TaxID=3156397 RepID=A0AAU8JZ43_9ACTN